MSGHEHEQGPLDRGLVADLAEWKVVLGRRRLLQWAASSASVLACSGTDDASTAPGDGGACSATIPPETPGPFPGDGTNNGATNALTLGGIVRSDIRTSVGPASGVAGGVPVQVRLTIQDPGCTPLDGHAVYIWHCDREGRYSMYSAGAENENYCRGVLETDADGVVEFTTIFPACYPGRWPHIHFEIFSGLSAATVGGNSIATSQLAFPKSSCDQVFATSGYEASIPNLAALTLQTDGVFRDGAELQTASMSGNPTDGYLATLVVSIRP